MIESGDPPTTYQKNDLPSEHLLLSTTAFTGVTLLYYYKFEFTFKKVVDSCRVIK